LSKPEVYVFPDTNTFLHYETFDAIDWPSLVGNAPVVLCISRTVMAELEAKKFDQKISGRKRERVKKLSVKMDHMLAAGGVVRANVRLELTRHPSKDTTPADLNLDHPDDAHVAAAYERFQQHGSVFVVSADTGVRNTARVLGLKLVDLPVGSELPPEPDEHEAELNKLRLELAQARAIKRPKIRVGFASGAAVAVFRLRPRRSISDGQIESEIEDDIEDHQAKLDELTLRLMGDFSGLQDDLRKYYKNKREYDAERELTANIELMLFNDGDAPAKGVHILLEFPDRLIVKDEFRDEPQKPTLQNRFKLLAYDAAWTKMADPDAWALNGTRAELHRRTVVHSLHLELPVLYVRPTNRDDREAFNIKGRVVVTEPPLNQTFDLRVTLDGEVG
jgi:hypothetical protein